MMSIQFTCNCAVRCLHAAIESLTAIAITLGGTTPTDTPRSQSATGCQPGWLSTFGGTPGMNNVVRALAVHDDGGGGGPALYVAGSFTSAGGRQALRVAIWDGVIWSPVGSAASGMDNDVLALAVFDDGSGGGPALYAAGSFTNAGGVAANHIAKWDGVSWSPLASGLDQSAHALTVFDDGGGPALYAAGAFASAGGVAANHVAKWDGTSWSVLGAGLDQTALALTVFDDGGGPALHAGGAFANAGAAVVNHVAKWDGASWTALGTGIDQSVHALTVFDDGAGPALHAAGCFTSAGGVAAQSIAKWDGLGWSALGAGVAGSVLALTVFDDQSGAGPALFAAGSFTSAGGVSSEGIAKWDGVSWSPLASVGSGIGIGLALTVFDDQSGAGPALYTGGDFMAAAGVAANRVAKWDGASWFSVRSGGGVGSGMDNDVRSLATFDDGGGTALYAGGDFTTAVAVPANHIAKWDGTGWSALGTGTSDSVVAQAVFDDGSGPALHAGGSFTSAGGVSANHVASWDGTTWSSLGNGTNAAVLTLMVFDDGGGPALYAGGDFTSAGGHAANHVAKWDGTKWSQLGGGMDGAVAALMVFDDGSGPALYAGGDFTNAGGMAANHIAKWDGVSWFALGSGLNNSARSLTVFDDGQGGGPALYVGGRFTIVGGVPANRIAMWDGVNWSAMESGMNGSVRALTVFDDQSGGGSALFASGRFSISPAGDSFLAKWDCPLPPPVTLFCTAKTTLVCGAANISAVGTSSATRGSGFNVEAGPVRGCRAGLLLYSNQSIVPGTSFGGPGNGALCLFGMGLRRAGPIESGGAAALCDGVLSIDMNRFNASQWAATGCSPAAGQNSPAGFLGNMGTPISAQMWGRDSIGTGQVLTDGVAWVVGP